MNYMDVGLPHTEFYPKKQLISPPRQIPMSGLSRKYMGLEPVSRFEIECLVNRLSKPKKPTVEADDPEVVLRKVEPIVKGTGRFAGRKRMSSSQIGRMVDRLCGRNKAKEAEASTAEAKGEHLAGTDMETDTPEQEADVEGGKGDEGSRLVREDSVRGQESRLETPVDHTTRRELSYFRRESVRFKNGTKKSFLQLHAAHAAYKDHSPTRKDSFKTRDYHRPSIPYSKPIQFSQRSPSLFLKSAPATSKVGPSSPRAGSPSPRLAMTSVKPKSTSPRAAAGTVPSQRNTKQKFFPKTDDSRNMNTKFEMRMQLPIHELDDEVIEKVAMLNKSPRHLK